MVGAHRFTRRSGGGFVFRVPQRLGQDDSVWVSSLKLEVETTIASRMEALASRRPPRQTATGGWCRGFGVEGETLFELSNHCKASFGWILVKGVVA